MNDKTKPDLVDCEFVPLHAYVLPKNLEADTVLQRWGVLKRLFSSQATTEPVPVKVESELCAFSRQRLDDIFPSLCISEAVDALDQALGEWPQDSSHDVSVRFVVGQPYGDHHEILKFWAQRHGAHVLSAPDEQQILTGGKAWLETLPVDDGLWVLPNLEHCFLRHAEGLDLVRRLLDRMIVGLAGRAVIGCDSWAWAYLQNIWPLAQLDALTMQAFDGGRLARYFVRSVIKSGRGSLPFLNAKTGKSVLPDESLIEGGDYEISAEMRQIAALSRGNFGVARYLWRERLRTEPEKPDILAELGEGESQKSRESAHGNDAVIWVGSHSSSQGIPVSFDEEVALILHTILLHNGVRDDTLALLLPLTHSSLRATLMQLTTHGLIMLQCGRWGIPEMKYQMIRDFIRERGLLIDQF